MKKFFGLLLALLLVLILLTYWSVSVVPEELVISKVIEPSTVSSQTDSVVVLPSNQYTGNGIKRFMQGNNYRSAWTVPISAPVFRMDSMKILEEGGGTQTHSLRLQSPSRVVYSMRSINKDPEPLVPEIAKDLGLENIVIDGISAQHPYGALLAARISEAAGVLHTHPKVVFTPTQPALGNFNEGYGNKLYLLEYETEGKTNWTDLDKVKDIVDTEGLQELKIQEGERLSIDKRAFIRARLLDLLIGDWDRHAKQWGWVVQQQADSLVAIPLAGDRDNAFFRIDGVLPSLLTNELIQPLVRPFEEDIDHVPGYVYPVDVYFLKGTPLEYFTTEAEKLQKLLSDQELEASFAVWPENIQDLNKKEILNKLKSRKSKLQLYAQQFHAEIEDRDYPKKPLKGSEDLQLENDLRTCFDCR